MCQPNRTPRRALRAAELQLAEQARQGQAAEAALREELAAAREGEAAREAEAEALRGEVAAARAAGAEAVRGELAAAQEVEALGLEAEEAAAESAALCADHATQMQQAGLRRAAVKQEGQEALAAHTAQVRASLLLSALC